MSNVAETAIYEVIEGQYRAALEMLAQAIEKCSETLWLAPGYPNKFWHVAYHTLYYTQLYLQPSPTAFTPWAKHRTNYQFLGALPWPPNERAKIDEPYSKPEVVEYLELCRADVGTRVRALDLESASGFPWLPFSRLGAHLYSLRHIQHHAGQLADRLRTQENTGVAWVVTA